LGHRVVATPGSLPRWSIEEGGDVRIPGEPEPAALRTVADVITRMEELSGTMPVGDGVRAFNQMYLVTTQQVEAAIGGAQFEDPEFMTRLDVNFANLYFVALAQQDAGSDACPRSWDALFDARARSGVSQLQFAVAGMNAHINYDLPRALVMTARELGGDLDDTRRADYVTINGVLARTQPMVREQLLSGPLAALDDGLGDADDRVAMWGIEQARDFAWTTGQTLWAVRGSFLERAMTDRLDRMVQLTSRLLLGAER
jgi:hypothetical protein